MGDRQTASRKPKANEKVIYPFTIQFYERTKSILADYSRYTFTPEGVVTSKSTGTIMKFDEANRVKLTKDDGSRKWVYLHDIIKELAAPGTSSAAKDQEAQSVKKPIRVSRTELIDADPEKLSSAGSKIFEAVVKTAKNIAVGFGAKRDKKEPLTDAQVADIKKRLNSGQKNKEIAAIYNLGHSTVSDIKSGRTFGHIPAAE